MDNHLGNKIRVLRNENGWTLTELGQKLNVSKSTVSLWEKGGGSPEKHIDRIIEVFNVSRIELLGITDSEIEATRKSMPKHEKPYSRSKTYHYLLPRSLDSIDVMFFSAFVITYITGFTRSQLLLGLSFITWIIFVLVLVIGWFSGSRKAPKTTAYYYDNQQLIYQYNESKQDFKDMKKTLTSHQFMILILFMIIIFSTTISFTIINGHTESEYNIVMGSVILFILLIYGIFMVEDFKVRHKIKRSIAFNDVPKQFGIWRYNVLFCMNVMIYIFLFMLLDIENMVIVELGIVESIIFSLLPLAALFHLIILREYRRLFSRYDVIATKK